VIIWFNGGSGCSSLLGYTLEHGPYIVNENSTEMTENPNSWNKNATVFYIESPGGVGFSLCGDDKECLFNDTNQAEDNLIAVLTILREKFPALRNNPLWISGQKHGGIVVPYLMTALDLWIVNAKREDPDAWIPNLKGQIISNGITDWKFDGFPAYFKMSFYHGLIDDELYE